MMPLLPGYEPDMISKLKAVLDDDRGVSPVIGVILMVAITVILAAVIGTFVLGLGDSLEQAPQAQLDAEASSGTVTISHNGGDAIALGDIKVVTEPGSSTTSGFSAGGDNEFNVGDSITAPYDDSGSPSEVDVQFIHEPSQSIILDTNVTVS